MKPRRNKRYQPRPVRIPITGLRDMIALHMHASLAGVAVAGDVDSFNSLADIMNMVSVAIDGDKRYAHEQLLIQGGVRAMNDILARLEAHLPLQEHHIAPVRVAVTAIDCVLPWLDVTKLYLAEQVAVAAGRAQRQAAEREDARP